ncbi:MAG: AAA family ATPase [Bacteroidales bacterium]|nr:AAA family ATPase [Bacteroidales bacterium]
MEIIKSKTLLDAIEHVATNAKNSQLDNQFFEGCQNELGFLADSYGITTRQAALFCICLERCGKLCDYDDLANYLGLSSIRILGYGTDIDALVRRRLLRYRKAKEEDTFEVPTNVLKSLKHNEVFQLPQHTGLDCCELFERMSMFFDDFDSDAITVAGLQEELDSLLEQNRQVAFARKVIEQGWSDDNRLMLLFFCHRLVNENDDDIWSRQLDDLFESKAVFMRISSELRNEVHPFMKGGIIEHRCVEGVADTTRYRLTEQAKSDLLAELNVNAAQESLSNVLKPDSLTAKELFFGDSVGRQVEELASLLDQQRYKEIHERMRQRGFRQGFACLFHGAPGTGKTETVYQLARRTGRQVMVVDVPQIKSKWVGESEKNIKALFDRYRALVKKLDVAPILLFNEADAIIGIRKQGAQSAVDKMENTIQNIILQEMESLDGILIATTNLTENLDNAFERRFLYKIRFEKPDAQVRGKIWRQMIPELSQGIADNLASLYDFSGGQIENIARKYAVECILHGDTADLQHTLEELCANERIDNHSVRQIGFATKIRA